MFAALTPEAAPAPTPVRTGWVLVVDDEEGIRETLRDLLEDEGYAVHSAANGRDALTLLRSLAVKPCLVILDLIMPILDGNAVYRTMQADPELAMIPVVIATSIPSQAPPDAVVLRKPVPFDALLALLQRCC
jgi:two-component system, chemotaxis family, chemotaxis protein CheY